MEKMIEHCQQEEELQISVQGLSQKINKFYQYLMLNWDTKSTCTFLCILKDRGINIKETKL